MIAIIFILLVAGFALLEYKWASYALKTLDVHSSCDHTLAEPDQLVTWSSTVDNYSRLPMPFVRLLLDFPIEANLKAETDWKQVHCQKNLFSWYAEYRMTLRGRCSVTRDVTISFPERGVYKIGACQLGAGDLLGFREERRRAEAKKIVVMPRLSKQQTAVDAVGGFLGDVSVRRFILEDPILTIGFRDYTGREPMRAISWTRTAQAAGALQVKQYDHTAEHHVVVLLNTESADETQFEECLRLTRSVCEKLEQRKIPYGFRTNGNLPGPVGKIQSMEEGLGQRHLDTILYGLGCADATCFYSFRYLTRQTLKKRKSNESYIVITPEDNGVVHACIQELSNAVGNQVCVLTGSKGVEAV